MSTSGIAPRYAIGIDLGTSNCALAWTRLQAGSPTQILQIPQWESEDRQVRLPVLPSFARILEPEMAARFFGEDNAREQIVGLYARDSALVAEAAVVSSAKSWLCHPGVNRRARLLPWGSPLDESRKLSPVEASALYLSYLREAWTRDQQQSGEPSDFQQQIITITVPASFDQVAQRLTLEAAALAGFPPQVRLLEEPQACFYAWLFKTGGQALRPLFAGRREVHVLVCDIGGGTSDFSLFRLSQDSADLPLIERVAVSDHLLLGGDNMDLALARLLEQQLGLEASPRLWQQLVLQARRIKEEALLEDSTVDRLFQVGVQLDGGSGLFAQARTLALRGSTVRQSIEEGFFPWCGPNEQAREIEVGLREMGLPYARDSAITRQLASFLRGRPVDALLCNGGALTPPYLQQRLACLLGSWQGSPPVPLLQNDELHLAVARGAALFGRHSHLEDARKIGGGSGHSIYIEIQAGHKEDRQHLLCVIPQGAEVEQTHRLSKQNFHLQLNRPVQFQPYTSTRRERDHAGQIVRYNPQDFTPLPPLQTVARFPLDRLKKAPQGKVPEAVQVELEARLNSLGLLQLFLVSKDKSFHPPIRWELEFNLRALTRSALEDEAAGRSRLPPEIMARCRAKLTGSFGPSLLRELEALTGQKRTEWPTALLRKFWEPLAEQITRRFLSPEYETTWLIAAGTFLRPGFGDPLDSYRMEQLWDLQTLELAHPQSKAVREQYGILWRRVSGGLSAEQQTLLYHQFRSLIASQVKQAAEATRMAAAFERLSQADKIDLWQILLAGLDKAENNRELLFWSLGRLLNRSPLYGGVETVLPPEWVQQVFVKVSSWDWGDPLLAVPMLNFWRLAARLTNHRTIDLPRALREEIHHRLQSLHGPLPALRPLLEYLPRQPEDTDYIFGESLPPGLTMG